MSRRSLETLTDILVLVVSPILVMILVASLAFFLIQCFYEGQFFGRLNFATGLFVVAAVLVARIAIEEGREYASAFALPLGVVTLLSILQYTDIGLLAIPLVLFIWWSTDKLTWDCTVLDEQKDASGEGLLQTIGLDDRADFDEATTDREKTETTSLWQRWINRRRRHHTPGVWVIYFGLAAIPLFGIGQSVLPDHSRGAGFLLLCTYVASALALLMITSFLQMRRYLIQRRLPFTEKMAATWLGTGGMVIIVLMLLCLALPRPNTGYSMVDSLSDSLQKASSRDDRDASDHGMGKEGQLDEDKTGAGESDKQASSDSQRGSQQSEDAKKGRRDGERGEDGTNKSKDSRSEKGENSEERGDSENNDSNGKESDQDDQERNADEESDQESEGESKGKREQPQRDRGEQQDKQEDKQSPGSSRPKLPKIPNPLQNLTLPPIPKLVYILLVAIGILVGLYFYGRQIFAAVRAFLRDLAALFARLFGGKKAEVIEEEAEVPQVAAPRPFRSFKDPFATGMAKRLSPQQLVAYTFEALQAWAYEQQCARQEDQTPLEFAGQIAKADRAVGPHASKLAVLYNQAAYAPSTLGNNAVEHIQALWTALRQSSRRTK